MKRRIAGLLGALSTSNGLFMLLAPSEWYGAIPGVVETGPFNPHFVLDIGIAFTVSGLGLLAFWWRAEAWLAAVTGAAFLVGHAVLHLVGIVAGHAATPGLDLALVILPALVTAVVVLPVGPGFPLPTPSWLARRFVAAFERRYRYDATYLRTMLDTSPAAFSKLARLLPASRHRESAPAEAWYAAKIVASLTEDCGPCTQLAADMALEGGVDSDQVAAVLAGDRESMQPDTLLGFRFARSVIDRELDADEVRDAVRSRWGEAAVIDLTLAIAVGRIFPMMKTGLGYARECRRVTVDGRSIETTHAAVSS